MIPSNQYWFSYGGNNAPSPVPFGDIYNSQSWSNLNDFIVNNATVALAGNYINISGGASDFDRTLDFNYITALEKFTSTVLIKIIVGAASGFGIGVRSTNPSPVYNLSCQVNGVGRIFIRAGDNSVVYDSVSNVVAYTTNDILEISLTQNKGTITVNARNITQGGALFTGSTTFPSSTYTALLHNTGRFCIFDFDGTYQLQSWIINSPENKNAKLAIIGDSKTQGYYANTFATRYGTLLDADYTPTVVFAGGGDRTAQLLTRMPELLSFTPQNLLIAIGCNDLRNGVSNAVFEANLLSIYNQSVSAGINAYVACPFPENALDLTPQYNYITSGVFPANKVITETWTDFIAVPGGNTLKAIYNWGDGVHLSQAGHTQARQSIINSGKII